MSTGPHLDSVDLGLKLDKKESAKQVFKGQKRFVDLRESIIKLNIPIMLVFEGWDASGKGGTIRRLIEYMDARLLNVHAIAAPSAEELAHHYLWRFWKQIPARGQIGIFDRSWYGRVLVERIEGFATEPEWKRAYNEINEFERQLSDDGYFIQKFFLHISFDEQAKRFASREKDQLKSWKLTDEDYRNREKHPQYTEAINEMLAKTHTPHAPWHVISGNDKRYARVEVINKVVNGLEDHIKSLTKSADSEAPAVPVDKEPIPK